MGWNDHIMGPGYENYEEEENEMPSIDEIIKRNLEEAQDSRCRSCADLRRDLKAAQRKVDGLMMKYFVLKPAGVDLYAKASRAAMGAYADAIAEENRQLADDLYDWIARETQAESDSPK